MKKRTKILATLGPASSSKEVIRDLIKSGMDVARINLKHADEKFFTYSSILYKYNIKHYIGQNKQSSCYYIQSETRPEFHEIYNLFYGYDGLNENN